MSQSLPAMDAPSVAFAHLLDSMVIEEDFTDPHASSLFMTHRDCQQRVCEIEDGDDLRTLLNTALNHRC